MTIDTISQGTNRLYTASVRGQTFVVCNNAGQYWRLTNLVLDGVPQPNESTGPQPERVTLGPFIIGDTFRVSADIGDIIVEYDNVNLGGGVTQAQLDAVQAEVDALEAGLGASADAIAGTVGNGSTDNTTVVNAALNDAGSFTGASKVKATLGNGGVYKFTGFIDNHPSVALDMGARGGILVVPDANMSSANAQGAESAQIRVLRRTPSSGTNLAWGWSLSGVNLDARGITFVSGTISAVNTATDTFTCNAHGRANGFCVYVQSTGGNLPAGLTAAARYFFVNVTANTFQLAATPGGLAVDVTDIGSGTITWYTRVHGIRIPNPDNVENPLDGDPTFAGNKDYVAGRIEFCDIVNMPGSGFVGESSNGRLDVHSARMLNNSQHGWDLGGNDITMSGHWAAGGNRLFGLKVGNASGFFAATGNVWGAAATRSLTCGAVWINQRKLFGLTVTEFNDWVRIDGGASYWRGGVIGMCSYAPFNEIFDDDGIAFDFTPGSDTRLQYFNGLATSWSTDFIGNKYSRSTATNKVTQPGGAFPSWMNVGGDLLGNYGTSFRGFIDASSNAMTNTVDQVNSGPNVKPWTGNQGTFTAAGTLMTSAGHGFVNGTVVVLKTTGTLPGGLFAGVPYFVSLPTTGAANDFLLSRAPGVGGINTTSAGTGTHTWGNLSTLPYNTHSGGQVNYLLQDSFNCETRIGARGPAHSKLLLGIADDDVGQMTGSSAIVTITIPGGLVTTVAPHGLHDNDPVVFVTSGSLPTGVTSSQQYWVVNSTSLTFQFTDTPGGLPLATSGSQSGVHEFYGWWRTYAIEAGDRTQPSGIPYRHALRGMWELDNAEQYTDLAFDGRVASATPRTVKAGQRVQRFSVGGGGLAAATINLPTDMKASQFLDVFITGGAITALTWAVTGTGTINANSIPLPTATLGFTQVKLWYDRTTNSWYTIDLFIGDGSGTLGHVDGTAAHAGYVGEILSSRVVQGSAVALTTTVTANVTSLALTAGNWRIGWTVRHRGTGATCTNVAAGMSAASALFDLTNPAETGEETVSFTTQSGNLKTLSGSGYVKSFTGAGGTVYLVASATFTAGTMSAFGVITAERIS